MTQDEKIALCKSMGYDDHIINKEMEAVGNLDELIDATLEEFVAGER